MIPNILRTLSVRIERIGVDETDSDELRLKKRLMVGLSLFVIPLLLLWAAIYLISGEPVAAIFPLAYVGFSGGGVVFFAITRKFPIYRFGHLLLILLIPFGMHMVLGGFVQGSGAIVFSLLSPLAAMLVADRRQASW